MPPTYSERRKLKPIEVLYSVIALAVVIWAIAYVQMKWNSYEPVVSSGENFSQSLLNTSTPAEGKAIILNRVKGEPLTAEEKAALSSKVNGSGAKQYGFTTAEKHEVL